MSINLVTLSKKNTPGSFLIFLVYVKKHTATGYEYTPRYYDNITKEITYLYKF